MKILCCGPISTGCGYSNALQEMILSLDSVGLDVVARDIPMTPNKGEVSDRVIQCRRGASTQFTQ